MSNNQEILAYAQELYHVSHIPLCPLKIKNISQLSFFSFGFSYRILEIFGDLGIGIWFILPLLQLLFFFFFFFHFRFIFGKYLSKKKVRDSFYFINLINCSLLLYLLMIHIRDGDLYLPQKVQSLNLPYFLKMIRTLANSYPVASQLISHLLGSRYHEFICLVWVNLIFNNFWHSLFSGFTISLFYDSLGKLY